jgi:hypothetical protein
MDLKRDFTIGNSVIVTNVRNFSHGLMDPMTKAATFYISIRISMLTIGTS